MTLIGIDYSLNSPALTILKDNTYEFISLYYCEGKPTSTSKKYSNHKLLSNIMTLIPYQRNSPLTNTYQEKEINKLTDSILLTNLIVNEINKIKDDIIIYIEGYSFNSHSSSYIDLISSQTILRKELLNLTNNIIVIPPTEIKKFATGKGNATKDIMVNSFISNSLNDILLENNEFYLKMKAGEYDLSKKPINDIVDSYFILKTGLSHYYTPTPTIESLTPTPLQP